MALKQFKFIQKDIFNEKELIILVKFTLYTTDK